MDRETDEQVEHPPGASIAVALQRIGEGLAAARREAGLTQEQLGVLLALTTSAIRHREHGRNPLTADEIPRYAIALRMSKRRLLVHLGVLDPLDPCGDCLAIAAARLRERRNPDLEVGASADGSSMGESSTACDPRGDASHPHPTAQAEPAGTP